MIEFADLTLREGHGNYLQIKEIMSKEGPPVWMLSSEASVVTPTIASSFTLRFWNDGKVHIAATTHPPTMEAPDDDLRFLKEWCELNGWQTPIVKKDLLDTPQEFDFWMRIFYIGLIKSDVLEKHEEANMERMNEAYQMELQEEDDENAY